MSKVRIGAFLGIAAAVTATVALSLPYQVDEQTVVILEVRPMAVSPDDTQSLPGLVLTLPAGETVTGRIELPWADGAGAIVELEARAEIAREDRPHTIHLVAVRDLGGGEVVRSARTLAMRDGSTSLFEALVDGDRRLTLAVTADRDVRVVARRPTGTGRRINLLLQVEKVIDGEFVALESNELNTFSGEAVEYSFRRGAGETLERLHLTLRPWVPTGDVITVDLELTGTLHAGSDAPLYLSHNETLITNRDTTSAVIAAVGDPPNGYRFLVTPRF